MSVAVVILNWNGRKMLERFLPTVVDCSAEDATIVVADNASTDDSLDFVAVNFPQCRIIKLDRNYGFAEGYNKALRQVDADYFVLLNSDVEVTPHWIEPLLSFMNEHDEVAACQPKLLSLIDRGRFEYAGACGGFLDKYGYPFCRGRLFDAIEKDDGQYDNAAPVLWATGACLMIRSADYWDAGGLDGRFFAHNEEIDLCWRLRIMGRKIYCLPTSVVYHLGGGTLPKTNPAKTFLNFRNNLTMLYKNTPANELRKVMAVRCILDFLAAIEMLVLKRNFGDFKAVFKARRAFRKWKDDFKADRNAMLQYYEQNGSDISERKNYSILWQYYVKGIRRFSDLK